MITAGQTIGNYRILHKIGTGGMGAVYLAEHPLIGKRVALKVIHRELASNRDVVSRFFQEARAVNTIGNDHIVEIHDFGKTPDGDHFFIMEYLEGRTLAQILAREGKVEVMRALHVGAQIASALAAAHTAGIIHRDLKPDNIMLMARLGDQDFVKVLDFGLAKVFLGDTAVRTAAGVLLGTPHYMSPEACESKGDLDHRTDIYALGVLLFQMMTGVLPFDGESMGEVLVKQVTALPPAPRGINPAIQPSVEQILLRCLAKRADARFPSMTQLREALLDPEAYLRGSPPILPARSVAPGEAPGDKTMISTGAANPPGPYGDRSQGQARQSGQQPQHSPQGPNPSHQPPAQEATRLAMVNPQAAAAAAPTIFGGLAPAKRGSSGMPALAPPSEPKMNTMQIATPLGYSSRPPRKVWPAVFAVAVLLGVGVGIAVTRSDRRERADNNRGSAAASSAIPQPPAPAPVITGSATAVAPAAAGASPAAGANPAAASTPASASAAAGSAAVGTTPVRSPSAAATPRAARLSIDSVPSGAAVSGPDGGSLGRTPLKVDWPVSDLPVTFELTLDGYRRKQKQTVVNGNTALYIELDRAVSQPGNKQGGGGSRSRRPSGSAGSTGSSGNRGDGLMRPD